MSGLDVPERLALVYARAHRRMTQATTSTAAGHAAGLAAVAEWAIREDAELLAREGFAGMAQRMLEHRADGFADAVCPPAESSE